MSRVWKTVVWRGIKARESYSGARKKLTKEMKSVLGDAYEIHHRGEGKILQISVL